jgi:hypothetical protein
MEIKTIDDLFKAHTQFAQTVQQQIETLHGGKPTAREILIERKTELLNHFQQRLDAANQAKAKAIERYEAEIQYCNQKIVEIEKEIQASQPPDISEDAAK